MTGPWGRMGVVQHGPFQFYIEGDSNLLVIRHWETTEIVAVRICVTAGFEVSLPFSLIRVAFKQLK